MSDIEGAGCTSSAAVRRLLVCPWSAVGHENLEEGDNLQLNLCRLVLLKEFRRLEVIQISPCILASALR